VALHRVAFLNFNDERRFRANQCLFVVPTQSLVRYVGGVLPALGVSGVPVITYTSWARSQRLRLLPDSPLKYNEDPPENVSRVKKHPVLIRVLAEWVARQAAQVALDLTELPELSRATAAAAVAEWERLSKRALLPRLVGLGSWLKKSSIEAPRSWRSKACCAAGASAATTSAPTGRSCSPTRWCWPRASPAPT
jgi:hypothetical protein